MSDEKSISQSKINLGKILSTVYLRNMTSFPSAQGFGLLLATENLVQQVPIYSSCDQSNVGLAFCIVHKHKFYCLLCYISFLCCHTTSLEK